MYLDRPLSYMAYGLHFRSCVALPAHAIADPTVPDVTIDCGRLPAELPGAIVRAKQYAASREQVLLTIEGVGRFLISRGTRIVVDPLASATDLEVRLFLLGSALGALLHQRGLLALHASAVARAGEGVAFLGRSGAGKSTIAFAFIQRGWTAMADDLCALDTAGERPLIQPGFATAKLWGDSVKHLGLSAQALKRLRPRFDKWLVEAAEWHTARQPLPLTRFYVLRPSINRSVTLEELDGSQRFAYLKRYVFRNRLATGMGLAATHFHQLLATARGTRGWVVTRPRQSTSTSELIEAIGAATG